MDAIQPTAVRTASAILTLSKAAWKLAVLLTKLDYDSNQVDTAVKNLSDEVKSLSVECDLVYVEIDDVVHQHETIAIQYHDVENRMWSCIALQVDEADHTMQELKLLIQNIRGKERGLTSQAQLQTELEKSGAQITSITTKVSRHTDVLRTALLLIITAIARNAPVQPDLPHADGLDELHESIESLQTSSPTDTELPLTPAEASLVQCAHEFLMEDVNESRNTSKGCLRFSAWIRNRDSERRDQQVSRDSGINLASRSISSSTEPPATLQSLACTREFLPNCDTFLDDSDDEFQVDLARAAFDTGDKAFKAQDWNEAHSLLQEALRIIHQLPIHQHAAFSTFDLQYKLAICAYHTKESEVAEAALLRLIQQPMSSDEQREFIWDARHRLSQLYLRKGEVERAHSECEKALLGRRRVLGKQNNITFESIALMARIHVLHNNRPLAKSYLAMIPEEHRNATMEAVEESLGPNVEHLDFLTLLSPKSSQGLDPAGNHTAGSISMDVSGPSADELHRHPPTISTTSGTTSPRQYHAEFLSTQTRQSPRYSINGVSEQIHTDQDIPDGNFATSLLPYHESPISPRRSIVFDESKKSGTISRKEILEKIGCHPRDRIEEAVCNGDHSTLSSLLNKKRDSWRLKIRKNTRSERVTALHFAALFGEIDMARILLSANYNINEVPYGYSTSLPPLKFAIGARQVDMVDFLLSNGAKPSEPDTWSTLAGQLLSRSWLMKTISEPEKHDVPTQIIAILSILLKYGWNVNAPFEASRSTLLHQAVSFSTGSFAWDVNLQVAIASFLCEAGADPFQQNAQGQTPYEQAFTTGHQDLVSILSQHPRHSELDNGSDAVIELAG